MVKLRVHRISGEPADGPGFEAIVGDEEVPGYGQDLLVPTADGPRRCRVVGLIYRAVLSAFSLVAEVYVADPEGAPADPCGTAGNAPAASAPAEPLEPRIGNT